MRNFKSIYSKGNKSMAVSDYLRDVKVDNIMLFENTCSENVMYHRRLIEKRLAKTQFCLSLRGLNDIPYIRMLLLRIALSKQLFVLDLEQGQEVLIPNDLSMAKLPQSFHFYDCLTAIVDDQITEEAKYRFHMKADHNKHARSAEDIQGKVIKRLYKQTDDKVAHKYTQIATNMKKADNISRNYDMMAIQRSNYLCIDQHYVMPHGHGHGGKGEENYEK